MNCRIRRSRSSSHKYGEEVSKPYGIFTVIAAQDNRTQEPITVKFHDIRKLANNYNENLVVEAVNKKASVIRISSLNLFPKKERLLLINCLEVYQKEALADRNLVANTYHTVH